MGCASKNPFQWPARPRPPRLCHPPLQRRGVSRRRPPPGLIRPWRTLTAVVLIRVYGRYVYSRFWGVFQPTHKTGGHCDRLWHVPTYWHVGAVFFLKWSFIFLSDEWSTLRNSDLWPGAWHGRQTAGYGVNKSSQPPGAGSPRNGVQEEETHKLGGIRPTKSRLVEDQSNNSDLWCL
jgi:hypothetical protein